MPNRIAHAVEKDVDLAEDLTAAAAANECQVNSVQGPTKMNIAAPMSMVIPPCIINILPYVDRSGEPVGDGKI